jgi:hypothetical protein
MSHRNCAKCLVSKWAGNLLGLLSSSSTMKKTPQSNNTCKRYEFLKKFPINFKMKIEII